MSLRTIRDPTQKASIGVAALTDCAIQHKDRKLFTVNQGALQKDGIMRSYSLTSAPRTKRDTIRSMNDSMTIGGGQSSLRMESSALAGVSHRLSENQ